jgi:hypothetical protein
VKKLFSILKKYCFLTEKRGCDRSTSPLYELRVHLCFEIWTATSFLVYMFGYLFHSNFGSGFSRYVYESMISYFMQIFLISINQLLLSYDFGLEILLPTGKILDQLNIHYKKVLKQILSLYINVADPAIYILNVLSLSQQCMVISFSFVLSLYSKNKIWQWRREGIDQSNWQRYWSKYYHFT